MAKTPVAVARTDRPDDAEWRADALGQSRHSRLTDALTQPQPVSEAASIRTCAQICRRVLGDLAPAIILLPRNERERCQTFAAWVAILFDFAWQRGVEGERLAALGRWHFRLEEVLEGVVEPAQPIFVRMLSEHRRRRWNLDSLDAVRAAAQRQITSPPEDVREAVRWTGQLAAALSGALVSAPPDGVSDLASGLLRLRALQDIAEIQRQRRPMPAALRLRSGPLSKIVSSADSIEVRRKAIIEECEAIRPQLLAVGKSVPELPDALRRPVLYLAYAGIALLTRMEARGEQLFRRVPHLSAWQRVRLLIRARLGTR